GVLDELGEMEWMQIAIKPSKPFAFGTVTRGARKVPVFGLPGNPVSSFVSFEVLARPALRQMMGANDCEPRFIPAIADAPFTRGMGDDKQHLVRAVASFGDDGRVHVTTTGAQGSHQLASSASANALVVIDDGEVVAAGDDVRTLVLDWLPTEIDPSRRVRDDS
ncbi:MAG TPA: molybdopterin-binding protein, partial [Acidimicrobiales bacterium]|nr:molybdopterin-binding protein [Acidimicrobiales bacterium]